MMLAFDDARNQLILKRTKFSPTKSVDDVMLDRRMKEFEVAHRSNSMSSTWLAEAACRSTPVSSDSLMVSE